MVNVEHDSYKLDRRGHQKMLFRSEDCRIINRKMVEYFTEGWHSFRNVDGKIQDGRL
jgi:hypothetical protein